jgi:hypothetical protein
VPAFPGVFLDQPGADPLFAAREANEAGIRAKSMVKKRQHELF